MAFGKPDDFTGESLLPSSIPYDTPDPQKERLPGKGGK